MSRALELPDAAALPIIPGRRSVDRLANGLTVCRLENHQAPLVTSALFYRAGARDEAAATAGTAHFLEHMMFKGSPRYGAGEIDRRTQRLGGSNNAFTSHDATAYYFDFAPDRWHEALAIEADRMAALNLDPDEVASERQVILEEVALYESEPWDVLDQAVAAAFFGAHPYGRPVLGTRDSLAAIDGAVLAAFHHRFYRPANAVLTVAGAVDDSALAAVEAAFGDLPAGDANQATATAPTPPAGLHRVTRRAGEVGRMLLALPGPAADHPDRAALRLLLTLLTGGRAGRLHRRLVDEGQLCSWVSADLPETVEPGHIVFAAELVPGADPARVEAEVMKELAGLATAPPSPAELNRCRQVTIADWVFSHEHIHDQAMVLAASIALFDIDHGRRQLERLLAVDAETLPALARTYLDPAASAVLGWSLPAGGAA